MHSHTNRRIANCAYTISYKADHRPIIMIILMYIRKIWISSTISIHTMNAAPMASPLPRHRAQVRSAEAGGSAKWFAALHCYRLGYFLAISLGLCSRYIVYIYIYAWHQRVPRIPRSQVLVGNHSQLCDFFQETIFRSINKKGPLVVLLFSHPPKLTLP